MWPFRKKAPPPPDVTHEAMTARYDPSLQCWRFHCDCLEFNVSGVPLDPAAFDWAQEAVRVIRDLHDPIRARVMKSLEGWPCDKTKAYILSVDLDDYAATKTFDVAFAGDESWGDLGVNVIITDGRIADVYAGD